MEKKCKVAIIGGASITWTPTFLNDLSRCAAMEGGRLVLHDIDGDGVEKMRAFGKKLFRERGRGTEILVEPSLDEAIRDADFVVCTVLIGSHEGWKAEMDAILKNGVPHPKGMSVGPGGLGMGLKQIPFIVQLAKRMEELCPNAWLLNFSNPMQTITYAVSRYTGIKVLGLCHGVTNTIDRLAKHIGLSGKALTHKIGGVNHFEIITRLSLDGTDKLPQIAGALEAQEREKGGSGEIITTELYRLFGGFPCNEDIHVMEFPPYYIRKGARLEDYGQKQNYIENRMKARAETWKKVEGFISGTLGVEQVVDNYSEKLQEIIDGVCRNTPTFLYANVMNDGYIENLSRDTCVEVPVVLMADGYLGCGVGELPRGFAALSGLHGAVQEYTVKAAMEGSRPDALRALALDPMCFSLSAGEREKLLDDILTADRPWLPEYWKEG